MAKENTDDNLTLSVPEAGRKLGLGRDKSYQAARDGTLPVLRFGRLLRVPKAALHQMLESARPRTNEAA